MANNIDITAGTGTAVATDDVAGVHYQAVKLVDGTEDASTRIVAGNGTASAALRVTIANDSTGTVTNSGNVAHDAADSGNPVKFGAKAESSPAGITAVADGDRTDAYADIDGLLMTKPFTSFGDILVERLSDTGGTATASTVFGATASAHNLITTIAVYNDSSTNGFIDFRDGTAGTIIFTLPLPAKGGAVCNFPLPLRQPTANTAFAYDVSAALTTVYISLIGFKSRV